MRSACGSLAVIAFASTACEFSSPPIIAPAIAPPPMNASDRPLNAFAARFSAIFATFSIIALHGPAKAGHYRLVIPVPSVLRYGRICPVPSITHL